MVDYSYSDARLAALYDRLAPLQNREVDFYLPMIMAAATVLDVGCGTGALLHRARQAGHRGRLCGLEPAAGMMRQARKRPDIEWICGDLTSVEWVREFALVVMTGHAFQVFIEDSELRIALAAIRTALKREGRFAFDTRNPSARLWATWIPDNTVDVTDEQGNKVRMRLQVETPFNGRTLSFTQSFASKQWNRPLVSRSTLRFLDASALGTFLAQAGLAIEAQFGDWDRQPLTSASPEIITLARPDSS